MRSLHDRLQVRGHARAIDENRLRGAANARAPQLRVLRDAARHLEIRTGMHVRVADAFEMAHDRHARILLHARDETFAAARHDDVDVAGHVAQHDADGFAILRRHHLHGRLGQAMLCQRARETRVNRSARARALGAAAQDRRVAALQAQRGGVGRDVRPALVDDADDAERHAHARNRRARSAAAIRPRLGRPDRRALRRSRAPRPSLRGASSSSARRSTMAPTGRALSLPQRPRRWPREPRRAPRAARAPPSRERRA